jgi:NTE family protein
VADELEWIALPGGAELFQEMDAPDAVYVLIAGCLGAFRTAGPQQQLIGRVHPGETVGEMALLSGHRRTATVRALRDSEVARFSLEAFERLARAHPEAMLAVARIAVERLERTLEGRHQEPPPRTLALVPAHDGIDMDALTERLGEALARFGEVAAVDPEHFLEAPIAASACGRGGAQVRAVCGARGPAGVERALSPAGRLPAAGGRCDAAAEFARAGAAGVRIAPVDRAGAAAARAHRGWRGARLARAAGRRTSTTTCATAPTSTAWRGGLARRSVGVVFSGGGARGFAHIGAIRALREAGLAIDAVGGTSIGALMAAAVALEWEDETLHQTFHRAFVSSNPLSDYTLPLVSLVAGRKASKLLRREFGEGDIEDLPLPFYCVSADLAHGRAVQAYRSGPLWQALRASIAIPGVLPPVCLGGQVLVDGGVIDNLPVDQHARAESGPVIGVDIAGEHALAADLDETDLPSIWQLLRTALARYPAAPRHPAHPAARRDGQLRVHRRSERRTVRPDADPASRQYRPAGVGPLRGCDWRGYGYTQELLGRGLPFG